MVLVPGYLRVACVGLLILHTKWFVPLGVWMGRAVSIDPKPPFDFESRLTTGTSRIQGGIRSSYRNRPALYGLQHLFPRKKRISPKEGDEIVQYAYGELGPVACVMATLQSPLHPNEDLVVTREKLLEGGVRVLLLAILDGHGVTANGTIRYPGRFVAWRVGASLNKYFSQKMNLGQVHSSAAGKLYLQNMLEFAKKDLDRLPDDFTAKAGTTISVTILKFDPEKGLSAWFTNLGDSRITVTRVGPSKDPGQLRSKDIHVKKVETLTDDHNLSRGGERVWFDSQLLSKGFMRVPWRSGDVEYRQPGGAPMKANKPGDTSLSRIRLTKHYMILEKLDPEPPYRVIDYYGSQLTGSLGDTLLSDIKRTSVSANDIRYMEFVSVSSKNSTTSSNGGDEEVEESFVMLVVATDGVWAPVDHLQNNTVSAGSFSVSGTLFGDIDRPQTTLEVTQHVRKSAVHFLAKLEGSTTDDITLMAVMLSGYA